MHVLILNQTFYPDVAASAQYASDLAAAIVEDGHQVTVITSRRSYITPGTRFPPSENWRGVQILRCWSSGFGKSAKWKRALDFAAFLGSAAIRLAFTGSFDVVVALTSPPLISVLGAATARWKKARFIYWVMDLNPDEAIAAGWLRADSFPAKMLDVVSNFSLRQADQVVVLDRFMAARLARKGVPEEKLVVIPPWPQDDAIVSDPDGAASFRSRHGLSHKFVVMYSGNHSPCHPLDTLMEAAQQLREKQSIVFCFVGGGSEYIRVAHFAEEQRLQNIICLPYQPLVQLSASLSAADLHAVVMGDLFVGIVHPSKVYNIRRVEVPFLYIGPESSPVAELGPAASFRHGDVDGVAEYIAAAAQAAAAEHTRLRRPLSEGDESKRALLLDQLLEVIGGQPTSRLEEPVCG